jgi:trans-2,3-dihydro-3-hydroxyanthranilate isomerase
MKSYRYLHLDVFTSRLFGGNQLAVVLDARGLDAATQQAIAKEMNFSETTFVFPPDRPETDVRVRIFTPADELPMAGHPTIGTAFALARSGVLDPGRARVVFGLGIGPTEVQLTWRGRDLSFAWMAQLAPTFGSPLTDRAVAAGSLRLPLDALVDTLPLQTVSCGLPYLLLPLRTRQHVDAASLDADAFGAFKRRHDLNDELCAFVFTTQPGADGATAYSRMFAPSIGIGEDPATGSASGPLGCYLVRHAVVAEAQATSMLSRQGVKMGRPSDIHISIGVNRGEIASVRVGGEAVVAGEGTLYI